MKLNILIFTLAAILFAGCKKDTDSSTPSGESLHLTQSAPPFGLNTGAVFYKDV